MIQFTKPKSVRFSQETNMVSATQAAQGSTCSVRATTVPPAPQNPDQLIIGDMVLQKSTSVSSINWKRIQVGVSSVAHHQSRDVVETILRNGAWTNNKVTDVMLIQSNRIPNLRVTLSSQRVSYVHGAHLYLWGFNSGFSLKIQLSEEQIERMSPRAVSLTDLPGIIIGKSLTPEPVNSLKIPEDVPTQKSMSEEEVKKVLVAFAHFLGHRLSVLVRLMQEYLEKEFPGISFDQIYQECFVAHGIVVRIYVQNRVDKRMDVNWEKLTTLTGVTRILEVKEQIPLPPEMQAGAAETEIVSVQPHALDSQPINSQSIASLEEDLAQKAVQLDQASAEVTTAQEILSQAQQALELRKGEYQELTKKFQALKERQAKFSVIFQQYADLSPEEKAFLLDALRQA